jgi:hypothetical protein
MSGFRAVTVRNILRLHDPFSSPAMISALESAIASESWILPWRVLNIRRRRL